ncbi:MAG TPA: glycosyltransferase [Rhizomicrobium sp.]|jgi:hypothetical protein|nr:glycosyltransferase [Rhizomicrobium sp.]
MRVAYFVHDLNDPAVARRIMMLHAGGLDVVATGFWRGLEPPRTIAGAPSVPLGRSFDGRLVHRGLSTLRHALTARSLLKELGAADLFVARNLEMLAIATAAKRRSARTIPLVYEVLDIHRSLLGKDVKGRALRMIERGLLKDAALLVTSSPAFQREYFERPEFDFPRVPTLIVENKLLQTGSDGARCAQSEVAPGPPWRIGWIGMIRCRRSLQLLGRLALRRPDLVSIEIHGRPASPLGKSLEQDIRRIPSLRFQGGYGPEDLEQIYSSLHFNWAIDYFEENGNSEWLLPNRIYEGGGFDAVALALRRTETGRWLGERGLGIWFDDPSTELEPFLEQLTPERYRTLKRSARAVPRSFFVAERADCTRLAWVLMKLAHQPYQADGRETARRAA